MSWFFHPVHKAQKDRAILKRVDQTLSRQGLPSALLHFVVFIVLEWVLLLDGYTTPDTIYFFGFALVIMTAWRFVMIAQFESWYGRGPAKWRDQFILSGFLHGAIWAFYLLYRLVTAEDHPILLLGILYSAAIAAGGTFVYSLYGTTVRYYLAILLTPLSAYFLFFQSTLPSILIGLSIVGLYAYLVSTASKVADLVWSFLKVNHEYKLMLTALEQSREATTVESSSNRRFVQQIIQRLKTPLSGMLGVMNMLSGDNQTQESQSMLTIAKRSGFSILDLMNDLEAFIEQRDQTRVPQSIVFNLRKTLEHALSEMGAKAHETGRELSYLYHPDVPERITADPSWLSNAFRRLLDFAIDSAEQGEITVKIASENESQQEYLLVSYYFINEEVTEEDLRSAIDRQMDVLPEDEDISDQLTLMVAAAQFKAMGATLTAQAKNTLKTIVVRLPIEATTQQASSFKPMKYMAGKSIMLVDLSAQTERSLVAEFMSWSMNVTVWTLDRLLAEPAGVDTDFVFINVPVDDQKAEAQFANLLALTARCAQHTNLVLYASELQRNLLSRLSAPFIFVEKPVARDQLLESLRLIDHNLELEAPEQFTDVKVLVAEDNLLNQKVVVKLLQQLGAEVDTVNNGQEAIAQLASDEYQLVLMDNYMPRLDGVSATQRIRKAEVGTGKHIPIIAMTSDQSAEQERECLAAGVDDFLSKPLRSEDLVAILQRWSRE